MTLSRRSILEQQNQGSGTEVHGISAAGVRTLSNRLERVQVLLQRLQFCVVQSGFKG